MLETSKEERYFLSQIKNLIDICDKDNYADFSLFLDEKQQQISQSVLHKNKCKNYHFYGGHESAKRKVLCVYPDYIEDVEDLDYPLRFMRLEFSAKESLNHRDFLGSLMGLNIKREMIGDIFIFDDYAIIVLHERIFEYVQNNLTKVGNVHVTMQEVTAILDVPKEQFEAITGVVASFRLDCIVSLVTKTSRNKASMLICEGRVSLNYTQSKAVNNIVKPKDVLSIRGYGKFVLLEDVRQTKKDRYHITVNKFI